MAKTLDKLQSEFIDSGGTKYVSQDNRYTFWPESDLDGHGTATSHDHLHVTLNNDSFRGSNGALSEFHITYYHNRQGHMPIHIYFTVVDGNVAIPNGEQRAQRVDANGCGHERQNAIANATGRDWAAIQSLAVIFVQRAFGQMGRQARRAAQQW
jgi:hypothetical protein